MNALARALGLIAVAALGLSCRGVLGVEDRKYDPAIDPTRAPACSEYCAALDASCGGVATLYASVDTCEKTCSFLPAGTVSDTTSNTVGCRRFEAQAAQMTGEAETCEAAGPGGNDLCGSNCEAYCMLLKAACPSEFAAKDDCLAECAALPDRPPYKAPTPDENSIQCRLFHVSNASVAPAEHCPHAAGFSKCVDKPDGG